MKQINVREGYSVKWKFNSLQFVESEDAKKALEQMNGFELAGRPMKVGQVTERADAQAMGAANATGHSQV